MEEAFDEETVVTLVLMHWIQGAVGGLRFYREAFGARREAERTFETFVGCPTGVSMYAKEQLHVSKPSLFSSLFALSSPKCVVVFGKKLTMGCFLPLLVPQGLGSAGC